MDIRSVGPSEKFRRAVSSGCVCAKSLQSCPTLCDPMGCGPPDSSVHGILRQEYWSGLPCPPPGDLPDPGMEPQSPAAPALHVDSLPPGHRGSRGFIVSETQWSRKASAAFWSLRWHPHHGWHCVLSAYYV